MAGAEAITDLMLIAHVTRDRTQAHWPKPITWRVGTIADFEATCAHRIK
jgi:hypothetical protein